MYKVQLDHFGGPLDLLLYFIRRDEIDIYDIPIAQITAEYIQIIEYIKTIPYLIKAVQELSTKVEVLEAQISGSS